MREGELKAAGLRPLREVLFVLTFFNCNDAKEARMKSKKVTNYARTHVYFSPHSTQEYLEYLFWPP